MYNNGDNNEIEMVRPLKLNCVRTIPLERYSAENIYNSIKLYGSEIFPPHMGLFQDEFFFFIHKINRQVIIGCLNIKDNKPIFIENDLSSQVLFLTICGNYIVSIVSSLDSKLYLNVSEFNGTCLTIRNHMFLRKGYIGKRPIIAALDDKTVAYCCERGNMFTVFDIDNGKVWGEFAFDNREFQCFTPVGSDLIACGYKELSFFGVANKGRCMVFNWKKKSLVYKCDSLLSNPEALIRNVIAFGGNFVVGWSQDSDVLRSSRLEAPKIRNYIHIWDLEKKSQVRPKEVFGMDNGSIIKLSNNHFAVFNTRKIEIYSLFGWQ